MNADQQPTSAPTKVRVALFRGRGLDQFDTILVDEQYFADQLSKIFGSRYIADEIVSPVHTLYRPTDPKATHPDWFVMTRDDGSGELVDIEREDARELPRLLARLR